MVSAFVFEDHGPILDIWISTSTMLVVLGFACQLRQFARQSRQLAYPVCLVVQGGRFEQVEFVD
jgi:hypothetical protein